MKGELEGGKPNLYVQGVRIYALYHRQYMNPHQSRKPENLLAGYVSGMLSRVII